jgi:hypothetical protein
VPPKKIKKLKKFSFIKKWGGTSIVNKVKLG